MRIVLLIPHFDLDLFRLGFAPAELQTNCCRKSALLNYDEAGFIPTEYERTCTYCFPAEKRSAKQQAIDDTSSCDSDSSDSDNS